MSIEGLQAISDSYIISCFGKSDGELAKVILDLLIAALSTNEGKIDELDGKIDALDGKIDALETRVEALEGA